MSSATPSSTSVASSSSQPAAFKIVGVILAITSGLLIGSSFVFKKKGLLASQKGGPAGMIMMILGELCNFGSYAFIPAIIVTPLGALSVVICAILSSIFLKESLTFFGWCGCFLCIVGSVIIAINGPQESSAATIREFQSLFVSPSFIIYGSLVILTALCIILFIAPRWGNKNMIWYILICSLFGGLSVSCTQGLGSSIVTSVRGDNQFTYWFIYFLLVFVIITLVTEIFFLNKALALFNTAMVTPTYYVIFTFFTLVTSVILYKGLHATVAQIITVVLGFLVICCGIIILQMSKVDPETLTGLDRKSTILLQASRSNIEAAEKGDLMAAEEPGIDALRGSFGAFGSVIRARSVRSIAGRSMSSASGFSPRANAGHPYSNPTTPRRNDYQRHGSGRDGSGAPLDSSLSAGSASELTTRGLANLPRTQLYDAPVPGRGSVLADVPEAEDDVSMHSSIRSPANPAASPRARTIQFDPIEHRHHYAPSGRGGPVVHDHQHSLGGPGGRAPGSRSNAGATSNLQGSMNDRQLRNSTITMSTQAGSQIPEYSDGEDNGAVGRYSDPYDTATPRLGGSMGLSTAERESHMKHNARKLSGDPFRDRDDPFNPAGASGSQINLLNMSGEPAYDTRDSTDSLSSPEDVRRPFHSRTREYPGPNSSSDEEDVMARESLVANDSGSSRGGIRLIGSSGGNGGGSAPGSARRG
ncbi:DUF803-domain-containing protein [Clavulina sp. PMI_390]|nr:DUF803-domain-containing protein [Clavulina sp. PMI_390]